MKNKKAFTVVELVIVIAIIAILAAVLIPTFANIIKKANVSKDEQLIRNLNTALASSRAENAGKNHANMTEALEAAEKFGYEVSKINASATDNEILWDQKNDVFCYLEGTEVKYIPNSVADADRLRVNVADEVYLLWKIYNEKSGAVPAYASQTYSIYLGDNADLTSALDNGVLKVNVGVDTGKKNDIASIEYTNGGTAHTSTIIRTNSANTELVINASQDTVKHFDSVGTVHIIAVDPDNCYEENGKAAFTQIDAGKYKTTDTAEVELLFVTSSSVNVEVVPGTVDHAHAISEEAANTINATDPGVIFDYDGNGAQDSLDVYHHVDDGDKLGFAADFATNKNNEAVIEAVNEAIIPELEDKYEEETTAVVYNMSTKVYYEDLYTAIAEVPENTKTTLVLLKNISGTSNANYQIPANKSIVLDLNGKVLNTVAPDESTAYTIENKGTLVIKDATDKAKNGSGTGKITSSAVKPDMQDVPGYASNTITNNGNLTIESGIIENRGDGYACFAIDNQTNGNLYAPVLTINGGKMLQESYKHYAVRMFCNSTTKANTCIINGGVIEGGYAFWMQYGDNDAQSMASLTIKGGTFIARDGFCLYAASCFGDSNATNIRINISGGNFGGTGVVMKDTNKTAGAFAEITGGTFQGLLAVCGKQLQLGEDPGFKAIPDGYHINQNGSTFTIVAD